MITEQKEISVSLQDIKDAQQRIKGKITRTPLIRFYGDNLPGGNLSEAAKFTTYRFF